MASYDWYTRVTRSEFVEKEDTWHLQMNWQCFRSITAEAISFFFFKVCPWTYIYVSTWLQASCAVVNNATRGGGKVLSVGRLEMAKYRPKGSKWSYLQDNYCAFWQHWEGDLPILSSQTSRKKVKRKGKTLSKTFNSVMTSLRKTQRNTNIQRGKILDEFGIPTGRLF